MKDEAVGQVSGLRDSKQWQKGQPAATCREQIFLFPTETFISEIY